MPLQFWAVNNDGDLVEWTDRLPADTLEVTIHAEECTVGNSQITIRDTDAGFNIRGHRLAYFIETDAIDDDWFGIIGPFFVNTRMVTRDLERMGAARTWTVSLDDINTLLARRVQKGADAERPQESDIARLEWLLSRRPRRRAAIEIEDTDFIFDRRRSHDVGVELPRRRLGAGGQRPVPAVGQQRLPVQRPEARGRDPGGHVVRPRRAARTSRHPHRITNDLAEISPQTLDPAWMFDPDLEYGEELTFAPSLDAELDRDPSRVYSGAYVNWDGGWSYVQRPATVTDYAARDGVFQAELVKSQSAAMPVPPATRATFATRTTPSRAR